MEKDENIEEQEPKDNASNPEETDELGEDSPESESDGEEPVEPDAEEDQEPGEPNYGELLEKERQRLGKKVDKERQKRIEQQKKSLSPEEAEKLIESKFSEFEKRTTKNQANILASQLSGGDESLKELIILCYENRIVPSGNLEEDIDNAYAIATKGQVEGKMSELKKSFQSKSNRAGGSGAGAPQKPKKEPKYSKDILDGAKFAGVTPEEFLKKEQTQD